MCRYSKLQDISDLFSFVSQKCNNFINIFKKLAIISHYKGSKTIILVVWNCNDVKIIRVLTQHGFMLDIQFEFLQNIL